MLTTMNEKEEQKTKRKFIGKVRPTCLSGVVKAVRYTGWFLAQHSVAMLEQCCHHPKQYRNNAATLCCPKNRRCESSRVISSLNIVIMVTSLLFFLLFLVRSININEFQLDLNFPAAPSLPRVPEWTLDTIDFTLDISRCQGSLHNGMPAFIGYWSGPKLAYL